MLTVIVRRLLLGVPTLLALTALLFFSVTTILGTPASMMLGEDASPKAIAELNARYGFDRPAYVQYFDWLGRALTGDFGRSYTSQDPVGAAIAGALPVTLELSAWAILLAVTAAVGLNSLPNRPALRRFVVLAIWSASRCRTSFSASASFSCSRCSSAGFRPPAGSRGPTACSRTCAT
jgi:ABC-type microcin C transport system permease subunit YejB